MTKEQPLLHDTYLSDTPGINDDLSYYNSPAADALLAHFLYSPTSHDSPRLPQTVAHRGYKGEYPENTICAIERAIEAGTHALELDVHLSQDGVVVLSHVSESAPSCGTMLIPRRMQLCNAVSA